jgi:hypothetical protein
MTGFLISDNTIKGPLPFPLPAELWHKEMTVGIWVGGQGHDVCYNKVSHMEDTSMAAETTPCAAIDFHHNEGSELGDDGAELDGSERNTRHFLNRYANSLTGVSFQPVYGGPAYSFRNVHYNYRTEATKIKVAGGTVPSTSGVLVVHNTFVHFGNPWRLDGQATVKNCYSRNNLFIGTEGPAMFFGTPMENCDFDYDGFGGWSGEKFMRYNTWFNTPEEVRERGPIEKNHVIVDAKTLFASGIQPPTVNPNFDPEKTTLGYGTMNLNVYPVETIDLRLKAGTKAIGAGVVLPGFGGDAKVGAYLGAYAPGEELPHYGPRPLKK